MIRPGAVILWLIFTALPAAPAEAETMIRGGHPVCNSAQRIDDAVRALTAKDMDWFKRLEGCYLLDAETRVERLDGGFLWWGICRIRIGYGKIAWTPCANITRD